MTRDSDMNKETAFCKIIADENGLITNFVCQGLGFDASWLQDDEYFTIGFQLGNRLIGGLIYHNIRRGRDIWWTLYTSDKRWCNKRVLKFMFELAFNHFKAKRISMLADADNKACLQLSLKLGFRAEGVLRQYRDDGKDAVIMGILKNEYLKKGE